MTTITMNPEDWTHPALTELPWEHTEADTIGVHGIGVQEMGRRVDYGPVHHRVDCYCGWTSGDCATDRAAFDALVDHALQARKEPEAETFECDGCRVRPDGISEDGTTCLCAFGEPVGGCRCQASQAEWFGPSYIRAEIAAEEL
ncbi:hypothetical protein [Actinomadura rugatobispora]|uniref:Uncharacterized protein n=1 Tax=Actinomadura rugatobispora TaxID=1994 RepID=A0ABW0ZV59_9ACTN|nr:hypothetical protein GCM10010200_036270 [Actinomadura rugatobispora]